MADRYHPLPEGPAPRRSARAEAARGPGIQTLQPAPARGLRLLELPPEDGELRELGVDEEPHFVTRIGLERVDRSAEQYVESTPQLVQHLRLYQ